MEDECLIDLRAKVRDIVCTYAGQSQTIADAETIVSRIICLVLGPEPE